MTANLSYWNFCVVIQCRPFSIISPQILFLNSPFPILSYQIPAPTPQHNMSYCVHVCVLRVRSVFLPLYIYIYIYRYPLLSLYMSCCLMLNSQLSILKSQFSNLNPPSLNSQIPAYHVSRHLHFPIFQKNPYHSQHPA